MTYCAILRNVACMKCANIDIIQSYHTFLIIDIHPGGYRKDGLSGESPSVFRKHNKKKAGRQIAFIFCVLN